MKKNKVITELCDYCSGFGYTVEEFQRVAFKKCRLIQDCIVCEGSGKVKIEIIDQREKNKKVIK